MKIGVIGAGTMGQGIAKAFAQVEGNTVALCDIKQDVYKRQGYPVHRRRHGLRNHRRDGLISL